MILTPQDIHLGAASDIALRFMTFATGVTAPAIAPVPTITVIAAGGPGVDQVERLTLPSPRSSGTFTITFGANTTAGLAYNISAAAMQTALEGLGSIGAGNITVAKVSDDDYYLTFTGTLGEAPQAAITADTAGLLGITITEKVKGGGGADEQQEVVRVGPVASGHFHLVYSGVTSGAIAYNASAADLLAVISAGGFGGAGATFTVSGTPGDWVITFGGTLANTDVAMMTEDHTSLAAPATITTPTAGVAPTNAVQRLALGAGAGTFYLSYDGDRTTAGIAHNASAATVQSRLEAILGTGNVTVADTGGNLPYNITFAGDLAATAVPVLQGGLAILSVGDAEGFVLGDVITVEPPLTAAFNTGAVTGYDVTAGTVVVASLATAVALRDELLGPVAQTLGGTSGGITIAYRPETVGIEYDQVKSQVDAAIVGEEGEARGTLAETDLDQWQAVLDHGWLTSRAAASGLKGLSAVGLGGDDYSPDFLGARITVPRRGHAGLNIILDLFRVRNIEGAELPFNKRDPSSLAFTLRGYADPKRLAGKQLLRVTMETAAAT